VIDDKRRRSNKKMRENFITKNKSPSNLIINPLLARCLNIFFTHGRVENQYGGKKKRRECLIDFLSDTKKW
jgi:hypothetical protein